MRKHILYQSTAVVLTVLLATPVFAQQGTRVLEQRFQSGTTLPLPPESPRHVPGEILVKIKPGVSRSTGLARVALIGGTPVLEERGSLHYVKVRLPASQDVLMSASFLATDPLIEYAEPNYIWRASNTPNDTDYAQQWAHNNTSQTISDPMDTNGLESFHNPPSVGAAVDLDSETAWDLQTDCTSKIIAVIDSGINYNHADLDGNMWSPTGSCYNENGSVIGGGCPNHGWDFADDDNNPTDPEGHGTHVAGIIGAEGNNGSGIAGMCWNAKLMAVRGLGTGGGTTADIVAAIDFARHNEANIINMSLGGSVYSSAMRQAIERARDAGILVVVAAGNDGLNLDLGGNEVYPCEYPTENIVCVASSTQGESRSTFSNYSEQSVDIAAPGQNILSTWAGAQSTIQDDFSGWTTTGSWGVDQGFSFNNCGILTKVLANPSTICDTLYYSANVSETAHRAYTISGADVIVFSTVIDYYLALGDTFEILYDDDADPFSGGTTLFSETATDGGAYAQYTYNLTECAGDATCSVGTRLTTNPGTVDLGVLLLGEDYTYFASIDYDQSRYDVISGTSMATPYVAGIAALIWSYNPGYSYADVRDAIYSGGSTSSAFPTSYVTSQGKIANARGSLIHLQAPTGFSASVD